MVDATGLGRFVTGGILPVREGGARRALKYEDLLFLKEGKLERTNWRLAANTAAKANKAAAPSRWLNEAEFRSATYMETWHLKMTGWYDKDHEITTGIVAAGYSAGGQDTRDTQGKLDEITGDEVTLAAMEYGATPTLNVLATAYENMGKLKRTLDQIYPASLWASRRRRSHHKSWYEDGTDYEYYGPWGTDSDILYEMYGNTDNMTTYEVEETTGTMQYPYAKRAWLIVFMETTKGPDWDRTVWNDAVVVECTVTAGQNGQPATVGWPSFTSASVAQMVLESHGETYYAEPTRIESTSVSINIDISTAYLLIEHDFPATEPEEESGSGGE